MARLAEQLIEEKQLERAAEVIDLALEKMPVDFYGYYSLLVPFVDGYYKIGETEKAQQLVQKVADKYADRLTYFASLDPNQQYGIGEEIITEIERYRTLIEAVLVHDDKQILEQMLDQFMQTSRPFLFLYGEFDYYTELEEIMLGYYSAGNILKARMLGRVISDVYQDRMALFSRFPQEGQLQIVQRIKAGVMNYRAFLDDIKVNDTITFYRPLDSLYQETIKDLIKE
jgi:tetratricopeptide (TPR) repeat protein